MRFADRGRVNCPKRTLGRRTFTAYARSGRAVRGLVSMASSRFETAGPALRVTRTSEAVEPSAGHLAVAATCGKRLYFGAVAPWTAASRPLSHRLLGPGAVFGHVFRRARWMCPFRHEYLAATSGRWSLTASTLAVGSDLVSPSEYGSRTLRRRRRCATRSAACGRDQSRPSVLRPLRQHQSRGRARLVGSSGHRGSRTPLGS